MHVAVLDIGKTNAKVALVDTDTMSELDVVTRPNTVRPGPPYPHFDVEGIWEFLLESLSIFEAKHGIDRISVTTHGATFVLLDGVGKLATPVMDYEFTGPEELAHAYDALRPNFSETGSPRLPVGLNAGAQLHWLLKTQVGLRGRVRQVVSYPQYWSGRLTGHFTNELTSLGCHTDLWNPHTAGFSTLVAALGIEDKMAPLALAGDIAGAILPEIAEITGLAEETPVMSGIHDSNASLLPHLRQMDGPFSVVSTGTWVVSMAVGGAPVVLDPFRDALINVNGLGNPTPSARFMGGREFEQMKREIAAPTAEDVERVLNERHFLLPAVQTGSGPFPNRPGGWSNASMTPGEKNVALSWYLALMTAECLAMIGARGPSIVEGPFARNIDFIAMLEAATDRPVQLSHSATGTSIGASLLADCGAIPAPATRAPEVYRLNELKEYAQHWFGEVNTAA
ncbi:sugar (pentulose or hexulose) kinase [Maritimibacter alkaliphilus HTCC2654]|uniref:L-fuculokinase-like protein n=1 Tax=Maritimibacter alkaliphilus HTCC2654 TaxID=314271 RepID=A3VEE3_9RHOB|nr:FGGY-family carbohydrate kinase [Maritimibacter alkaliphilus]EAQ13281.1 L-fuculokinase-like protein [Rhodobacterales bacterium HTCC2654] [Maritimibacter alkaliphilus HTCC2654]TYP85296.1 sugar (pentulose or hexulose) kinase [Maritimibacter alkaliphilus HTCC2654]